MLYGLQTKITKEIDLKNLNSMLSKEKNPIKINIKLKEYDNFKKLIHNFLKKNFKYVSFVFGGFYEIHEESLFQNIPLLNHDNSCYICKKKYKKKKKKINFFSQIFKKKNEKKSLKSFEKEKNDFFNTIKSNDLYKLYNKFFSLIL
jgi:hypothetical protein